MFAKILIANRGEIACRIIKTAKRLGIKTVAVFSDADQTALHVKLADEAIHIGTPPSSESYLLGKRIIDAALKTGANAIHPGYGFLSENAEFAKACAKSALTFIGPPTSAIEAMGSKSAAKTIMEKAEVPLVPGYHGANQDPGRIKQAAESMGYPVLLKAVAGGGGKGMRQIWSADEFDQALADAKRESMASFGNDDMLVEKYLRQTRHVEVQVFCDGLGEGVYLFERDCSVQRRHQKIIEEAPAPNITKAQRQAMGQTAVRAAQAINYEGAGTVEFLLDDDGAFYFMEMNTRLQVEHPVTEMITGQDLVEWQFKVANGEPLPLSQNELKIDGHAFEARIYAEDPANDFLPTTGSLLTLHAPLENKNVRVDTGVIEGDEVSPFYDPMIAKLIVWDKDRTTALNRMSSALREYKIAGIKTNLDFLHNLVCSPAFIRAELSTAFIEQHSELLFAPRAVDVETTLCQAALFLTLANTDYSSNDPWSAQNSWRMNQSNLSRYNIRVDEQNYSVKIEHLEELANYLILIEDRSIKATATLEQETLHFSLDGHYDSVVVSANSDNDEHDFVVFSEDGATCFQNLQADCGDTDDSFVGGNYIAPMNGTIVAVLVEPNAQIKKGQPVLIMEAMKMQHTMHAHQDGTVTELYCKSGELVNGGTELLKFEVNKEE